MICDQKDLLLSYCVFFLFFQKQKVLGAGRPTLLGSELLSSWSFSGTKVELSIFESREEAQEVTCVLLTFHPGSLTRSHLMVGAWRRCVPVNQLVFVHFVPYIYPLWILISIAVLCICLGLRQAEI